MKKDAAGMTRDELVDEVLRLRDWREDAIYSMCLLQEEISEAKATARDLRAERDELRAELEAQGYWLGDPA